MTICRFFSKRVRQSGAALVELALVIPISLTLCTLSLETGRVIDQLVWAFNSAYQLSSALGNNQREVAEQYMNVRKEQITATIRQGRFPGLGLFQSSAPEVTPIGSSYFNDTNRTVGVTFTARIQPISNTYVSIPLKVQVVAPNLIPDQVTIANSANPEGRHYDCCGQICTGGSCNNLTCAPVATLCSASYANNCLGGGSAVCGS